MPSAKNTFTNYLMGSYHAEVKYAHARKPCMKVAFSIPEVEFLTQNEACRIATCGGEFPHVVPVSYVYRNGFLYFATDYETKKLENLNRNPKVALAIDVYSSVGNRAICIQGTARLIESGKEFLQLYGIFHEKFQWVRDTPWKEGEAPFVEVTPVTMVSWGIG
jgi:nitroimidazol reductase NimA-like FMN-containing flavoprotein (pyridoxamine 5'-phosphate oxidase superfamily)